MSKTQRFLDYIKETKSKATLKEYKHGIKRFSEWYGKDSDTVLEERRLDIASGSLERNCRFARMTSRM